MKPADRAKGISGVAGAQIMGGGQKAAPQAAGGIYTRSDGRKVPMADMNPYHRAAAAKKAEAACDHATAEALRASGPLAEAGV